MKYLENTTTIVKPNGKKNGLTKSSSECINYSVCEGTDCNARADLQGGGASCPCSPRLAAGRMGCEQQKYAASSLGDGQHRGKRGRGGEVSNGNCENVLPEASPCVSAEVSASSIVHSAVTVGASPVTLESRKETERRGKRISWHDDENGGVESDSLSSSSLRSGAKRRIDNMFIYPREQLSLPKVITENIPYCERQNDDGTSYISYKLQGPSRRFTMWRQRPVSGDCEGRKESKFEAQPCGNRPHKRINSLFSSIYESYDPKSDEQTVQLRIATFDEESEVNGALCAGNLQMPFACVSRITNDPVPIPLAPSTEPKNAQVSGQHS